MYLGSLQTSYILGVDASIKVRCFLEEWQIGRKSPSVIECLYAVYGIDYTIDDDTKAQTVAPTTVHYLWLH